MDARAKPLHFGYVDTALEKKKAAMCYECPADFCRWREIKIGPALTDGSDLVYVDIALRKKLEARKQRSRDWVKLAR